MPISFRHSEAKSVLTSQCECIKHLQVHFLSLKQYSKHKGLWFLLVHKRFLFYAFQLKRPVVDESNWVILRSLSLIRDIIPIIPLSFTSYPMWCICSPAYKSLGTSVSRLGVIT